MRTELTKYRGVFPAFYACYDEEGAFSAERTRILARHLVNKGVQGLYVGGSSGECIYLSKEERMKTLETVMDEARGKCTVIAHVACNNTADSMALARHAQEQKVDAIAAIPPIYFHLPERAIKEYWNDISSAAPDTDFFIYNIPQLAGVALTMPLYREMLKNPCVKGVKNSSMPTQDIEMFVSAGEGRVTVFNGPDEQFVAGRAIGASGGIGGTYAVMPELFLKMDERINAGDLAAAREIQYTVNGIISAMCACRGNLYAVMKKILEINEGLSLGSVRPPLPALAPGDREQVERCARMISDAVNRFTK